MLGFDPRCIYIDLGLGLSFWDLDCISRNLESWIFAFLGIFWVLVQVDRDLSEIGKERDPSLFSANSFNDRLIGILT